MRRRTIFRGRVQGVGFRYTTVSIARNHPITGYVRNLPDGSVELVADGDAGAIQQLLEDVEQAFRENITDRVTDTVDVDEPLLGFEIRR